MPITTREELINALHEASEIEHGLLVQYLYTALCMKKRLDEGLTTRQQALARRWQAGILVIAQEEMGHLAMVCGLLSAIGVGPRFQRPNMPQPQGYYPFAFDLLPFSDEALYRFLVFELPRGMPLPPPPGANLRPDVAAFAPESVGPIAPEPITFEFVGELYAKIAQGFRDIPESQLFIGPTAGEGDEDWGSPSLDIKLIEDRASALRAIQEIVEDGEGTEASSAASHYSRFGRTRLDYFDHGRFAAARNVPSNPVTRKQRDASGAVTLIKNPLSLSATELFNTAYGVMLLMLQHYFSISSKSAVPAKLRQREELKAASRRLMSAAVRPLAEVVTELPLDDAADPRRAGPSFEIYGAVELSPFDEARWQILLERFDVVTRGCRDLAGDIPRLRGIGETMAIMRRSLAVAADGAI